MSPRCLVLDTSTLSLDGCGVLPKTHSGYSFCQSSPPPHPLRSIYESVVL
ncbi:uncharacterized protein LACBIDRAFT_307296 [Laccaria bicolor S238N-H82]|uniref:Predicted protein n=1 Tax=Laccaria bicolor (strain S238N-H82 / ATCC MYA-4686) TaxID=486041 RepID=B0DPU7_LACBS|nr:uncharacterized protein LACBIDRAFT_307296 [Laccaria bicolor S238N-H82]EDR03518.1 predicted protein [Laccaria bicolor S238N-H82]|eukprot:XP_001885974.1 predicted protein [Laccaria bicolor S238N-H82]